MDTTNAPRRSRKYASPFGVQTLAHLEALDVAGWWEAMRQWALASVLAAGGAAFSLCGSGVEVNGAKVEVNGLKVDRLSVGSGGDQDDRDRAGKRAATEYEGRRLRCKEEADGSKVCW